MHIRQFFSVSLHLRLRGNWKSINIGIVSTVQIKLSRYDKKFYIIMYKTASKYQEFLISFTYLKCFALKKKTHTQGTKTFKIRKIETQHMSVVAYTLPSMYLFFIYILKRNLISLKDLQLYSDAILTVTQKHCTRYNLFQFKRNYSDTL